MNVQIKLATGHDFSETNERRYMEVENNNKMTANAEQREIVRGCILADSLRHIQMSYGEVLVVQKQRRLHK